MLCPSSHDSVTIIEDRLRQIHEAQDADVLQLPQTLGDMGPGAEIALIQLILTWAAFSRSRTLLTAIAQTVDAEQSLVNLAGQPCGRVALLAANSVRAGNGSDVQDLAMAALDRPYPPLQIEGARKAATLIVRSMLSEPREHAPFLNLAADGARGDKRSIFMRHITAALSAFQARTGTVPLHAGNAELAEILFELFANAEEWGCTNVNGAPIRLPLRGILFRLHDASTVRIAQEDQAIASYLQRERDKTESRHFLEVSVFDSGIGLAQRFRRKQIESTDPIQHEIAAVRECFAKHGTSTANSFRGLGLYHVFLLASQLRGFLRLRTGRLHLYRDFGVDSYQLPPRGESITRSMLTGFQYLRDWTTKSPESDQIVAHQYAKGAVCNILLPMKGAQPSLF
jgi:hypothetical protein